MRENIYRDKAEDIRPYIPTENLDGWYQFNEKYYYAFRNSWGFTPIFRNRLDKINDLCKEANKAGHIIPEVHKAFIYCVDILLRFKKYGYHLATEDIKELLGYSRKSGSINYLIKENGLMDIYNMTYTKKNSIKTGDMYNLERNNGAKWIKEKRLHYSWGINMKYIKKDKQSYLLLEGQIFLYMLFYIKEIKVVGIYLYCYFLKKTFMKEKKYYLTPISQNKIIKETGLDKNTIEKYILILSNHNLIEVKRGDFLVDKYGDYKRDEGVKKEINKYRVIVNTEDLRTKETENILPSMI